MSTEQTPGEIVAAHKPRTQTPEELIASLMEKLKATHQVLVFDSEEGKRREVFAVHNSSFPNRRTCNILRTLFKEGETSYGFHLWFRGTYEEVENQIQNYVRSA